MTLIELPNGAFVSPDSVRAVRWAPTETFTAPPYTCRARVIVDHASNSEVIYASDDQHAAQMCREIARQINLALFTT